MKKDQIFKINPLTDTTLDMGKNQCKRKIKFHLVKYKRILALLSFFFLFIIWQTISQGSEF
jgi:hypothetical protein